MSKRRLRVRAHRAVALLAAGAAGLTLAAPASARPVQDPADMALVQQLLPLARAAWPASPCQGREAVSFDDDVPADYGWDGALGVSVLGDDSCRIVLASNLPPMLLCTVLVHEVGHQAGHTHAEGGVMAATPQVYGPCRRAVPRVRVLVQAERVARWLWPDHRWACRRYGRRVLCHSGWARTMVRFAMLDGVAQPVAALRRYLQDGWQGVYAMPGRALGDQGM